MSLCRFATFLATVFIVTASSMAQEGSEPINIDVSYDKARIYRTECLIEHAGEVILEGLLDREAADQDQDPQEAVPQVTVQRIPIDVRTRLGFHERFIGSPEKPQVVRFYDEALAKIRLNEKEMESTLRNNNRTIVTRIKSDEGNRFQIASVADILEQREHELLKNPADSLSFTHLFTKSNLKVGDDWAPQNDDLARFLFVDYVIDSSVKLELKEISHTNAILHLKGHVKAEVDDTTTEIAIAGVISYDRKALMVRQLRLNIQENRRAAQIAPGFHGRTKVDYRSNVAEMIPQLTNESLQAISGSRGIRSLIKWQPESKHFEVTFDPAWRLISAVEDGAILRYVENGDLLTQCNIVRLGSRPIDKPLSLADFEREVAKVISKDPQSRIVSADEGSTTHGVRAMRILVSGLEQEVPVNWIYYNLSHRDGRQVTFVFTAEAQVLNRISVASQNLVNGLVFLQTSSSPSESATAGPTIRSQNANSANSANSATVNERVR